MLVFGDAERLEDPRAKLARIADGLAAAAAMPAGLEAHAALIAALIEAGELAQGIADAETDEAGADMITPAQTASLALVVRLARATWTSWQSAFRVQRPLDVGDAWRHLALPSVVRTRLPEGFAFYGVYPEGYALAALAAALPASTLVVGLRSIGTTLAGMVAAGAGVQDVVTVRPRGHPFDRKLALAPDLKDRLSGQRSQTFAVVDEGPGMSGSSFGAVTDALAAAGVAPSCIHLFPSHDNLPGSQASEAHRRMWAQATRHVRTFDDLVLRGPAPEHRLETWVSHLVGSLLAPLEETSGGAWRAHRYRSEANWPPAHPFSERRKFLARTADGIWLVKFAGLGREGARKAAMARALADAGFAPTIAGVRHGFIVERWAADAGTLTIGDGRDASVDAAELAGWAGRYLTFRATKFGGEEGWGGASPARLWAMARHNTAAALGAAAGQALERWETMLPELQRTVRPVAIDGRLHRWEWLVMSGSRLMKCDAVDHHAAHDLVGCQDIAWDVVGAEAELSLSDDAFRSLVRTLAGATARPLAPAFLAFHRHCYLAFQIGAATMAAAAAGDGAERRRWDGEVNRYGALLSRALYEKDG